MPPTNPQALHMLKLMRDFADEPTPTLANEIAGMIDKPTGLGEILARCFRAMADNLDEKPNEKALEVATGEGHDQGIDDMADAVKIVLRDMSTFDPDWIARVVKDARRQAS